MSMESFMNNLISKILCLALILFAFSIQAKNYTYICDYKQYSNPKGLHDVKNDFNITIIFDSDAEKSYMVGELGTTDLIPVFNIGGGITFIETTDSGNVMTTTIELVSRKSVHSRNSLVFGELIPSQYYGECEIKR